MSDFQKLLDQALEKVNLTPVDDTPEIEEYDIDVEVRDLVISARNGQSDAEAVGAAFGCIPVEHQQN